MQDAFCRLTLLDCLLCTLDLLAFGAPGRLGMIPVPSLSYLCKVCYVDHSLFIFVNIFSILFFVVIMLVVFGPKYVWV